MLKRGEFTDRLLQYSYIILSTHDLSLLSYFSPEPDEIEAASAIMQLGHKCSYVLAYAVVSRRYFSST
jgi:hypothetical protein